jgi:hypothetical protein
VLEDTESLLETLILMLVKRSLSRMAKHYRDFWTSKYIITFEDWEAPEYTEGLSMSLTCAADG